jgi:WhiB family transcriptional regulator, redox-sensing transcriptional regulator
MTFSGSASSTPGTKAAAQGAALRESGRDLADELGPATPRYRNPRPKPLAELWDWQRSARCRGEDPAIFFGEDFERGAALAARHKNAKQICAECPVMAECRQHAALHQEPFGVWGGLSEGERRRASRYGRSC